MMMHRKSSEVEEEEQEVDRGEGLAPEGEIEA
jgi:hypothetical protein